jgi:hypothetical protein
MSTVGDVMDRLYRSYLEPPDAQPAVALLDADIAANADTFTISQFMIPEDETLMAQGVVVEINSELILVGQYDPAGQEASNLVRGYANTTASTHSAGARIVLSPSFPRKTVFDAVADNILTLSPDLFTVGADETQTINGYIAPIEDPLAVTVIDVHGSGIMPYELMGQIIDFHPDIGGRALVLNRSAGDIWVRYRRRMGSAETETDTLESLGVEERWVNIVMAGAAADLFAGRDLPAAQTDWISATLEAETMRVGTRTSLATALARYRELLMSRARLEMRNEYRPQVRMRPVMR